MIKKKRIVEDVFVQCMSSDPKTQESIHISLVQGEQERGTLPYLSENH